MFLIDFLDAAAAMETLLLDWPMCVLFSPIVYTLGLILIVGISIKLDLSPSLCSALLFCSLGQFSSFALLCLSAFLNCSPQLLSSSALLFFFSSLSHLFHYFKYCCTNILSLCESYFYFIVLFLIIVITIFELVNAIMWIILFLSSETL